MCVRVCNKIGMASCVRSRMHACTITCVHSWMAADQYVYIDIMNDSLTEWMCFVCIHRVYVYYGCMAGVPLCFHGWIGCDMTCWKLFSGGWCPDSLSV